jgi:hypothetical protein
MLFCSQSETPEDLQAQYCRILCTSPRQNLNSKYKLKVKLDKWLVRSFQLDFIPLFCLVIGKRLDAFSSRVFFLVSYVVFYSK